MMRCRTAFGILVALGLFVAGCGRGQGPDVEATVQARLEEEAQKETAIARSVQQTLAAQTPVPTSPPPPTASPVPPTQTAVPPTLTSAPPTATLPPPTETAPPPPTPTGAPSDQVIEIEVYLITGGGYTSDRCGFGNLVYDGGGTDSTVELIIQGQTPEYYARAFDLDDPDKNDREEGDYDHYEMTGRDTNLLDVPIYYETITAVGLHKYNNNDCPDWLLDEFGVAFTLEDGRWIRLAFMPGDFSEPYQVPRWFDEDRTQAMWPKEVWRFVE